MVTWIISKEKESMDRIVLFSFIQVLQLYDC